MQHFHYAGQPERFLENQWGQFAFCHSINRRRHGVIQRWQVRNNLSPETGELQLYDNIFQSCEVTVRSFQPGPVKFCASRDDQITGWNRGAALACPACQIICRAPDSISNRKLGKRQGKFP